MDPSAYLGVLPDGTELTIINFSFIYNSGSLPTCNSFIKMNLFVFFHFVVNKNSSLKPQQLLLIRPIINPKSEFLQRFTYSFCRATIQFFFNAIISSSILQINFTALKCSLLIYNLLNSKERLCRGAERSYNVS